MTVPISTNFDGLSHALARASSPLAASPLRRPAAADEWWRDKLCARRAGVGEISLDSGAYSGGAYSADGALSPLSLLSPLRGRGREVRTAGSPIGRGGEGGEWGDEWGNSSDRAPSSSHRRARAQTAASPSSSSGGGRRQRRRRRPKGGGASESPTNSPFVYAARRPQTVGSPFVYCLGSGSGGGTGGDGRLVGGMPHGGPAAGSGGNGTSVTFSGGGARSGGASPLLQRPRAVDGYARSAPSLPLYPSPMGGSSTQGDSGGGSAVGSPSSRKESRQSSRGSKGGDGGILLLGGELNNAMIEVDGTTSPSATPTTTTATATTTRTTTRTTTAPSAPTSTADRTSPVDPRLLRSALWPAAPVGVAVERRDHTPKYPPPSIWDMRRARKEGQEREAQNAKDAQDTIKRWETRDALRDAATKRDVTVVLRVSNEGKGGGGSDSDDGDGAGVGGRHFSTATESSSVFICKPSTYESSQDRLDLEALQNAESQVERERILQLIADKEACAQERTRLAAIEIQRHCRGYHQRSKRWFENVYKTKPGWMVQGELRSRRFSAARRIQAPMRGRRARTRFEPAMKEYQAARAVQTAARGYLIRYNWQVLAVHVANNTAAHRVQHFHRSRMRKYKYKRHGAAQRVQRRWRGFIIRTHNKRRQAGGLLCRAARGMMARRRVERGFGLGLRHQIRMVPMDLTRHNATQIQRHYRGRRARVRVIQLMLRRDFDLECRQYFSKQANTLNAAQQMVRKVPDGADAVDVGKGVGEEEGEEGEGNAARVMSAEDFALHIASESMPGRKFAVKQTLRWRKARADARKK